MKLDREMATLYSMDQCVMIQKQNSILSFWYLEYRNCFTQNYYAFVIIIEGSMWGIRSENEHSPILSHIYDPIVFQ